MADAEVKEVEAKLKTLKLQRELGQTVSTEIIERELGQRAQALKLFLSAWMRDAAPELLSHLGGDLREAERIIEIVDGDPERIEQLSAYIFSRRPLLLDSFRRRLSRL